jgi:mannose-6-phosphate isomerase-like protein (cupin superfamily)
MTVKNTTNAEHYLWGDACDGWRLLARSDLAVTQERIPAGRGEVEHYHGKARQLFYVLNGSLRIAIESDTFDLSKGDSLEVPPTTPHRVWNGGMDDAHFLVISAPTTQGDRVNVS